MRGRAELLEAALSHADRAGRLADDGAPLQAVASQALAAMALAAAVQADLDAALAGVDA